MRRTMKAVVARRAGGPEVLELAEVRRPEPRAGEVLVRVHAAGVNASDPWIRAFTPNVWALALLRGAAIYVAMSEDWIGKKPARVSFVEAAGAPVGGMTAIATTPTPATFWKVRKLGLKVGHPTGRVILDVAGSGACSG